MNLSTPTRIAMASVFSLCLLYSVTFAADSPSSQRHPRPEGSQEAGIFQEERIEFTGLQQIGEVYFDTLASLSGKDLPEFEVEEVLVDEKPIKDFLVSNGSVINFNRLAYGNHDLTIRVMTDWNEKTDYSLTVKGKTPAGDSFSRTVSGKSPETRSLVGGLTFASPTADTPYHHVSLTLGSERLSSGTVTAVLLDGKKNRDPRFFNTGLLHPKHADRGPGREGESFKGRIAGTRPFTVTAPCSWTNGSQHTLHLSVKLDSGETLELEQSGTAPSAGGYWNAAWPESVSIVLRETEGLIREGEPVHLTLGLFTPEIANATDEIRVVTYHPHSPKAGSDGYVVAPVQVTSMVEWADEKTLNIVEMDPLTNQRVHRYDPTTTVELVFLADVLPYEERVYQVVYGNSSAPKQEVETDLSVENTSGIGQIVESANYSIKLATNSGAIETVTILGEGDPVILEHKLETNGAVHWNPGCYTPPIPWVHASDWEGPEFRQISGPVMHRTRRYANLPHMETVDANVSYSFYKDKPYVLFSSVMRLKEDLYVQALRNAEVVFNHAVLDEFIWHDPSGVVKSLAIEGSREHPIHALEVPPDTPWMAFISREHKVGFAAIQLEYANNNLFGDPASEAQPYIYVQNGPWIYWSRGLVYPFGGMNFTRLMRARAGSLYIEKMAWYPFRFEKGDDPFARVKTLHRELTHPLEVHEWMETDDRTPETWVMPLLTMPFDEGVSGAVSGQRE